MSLWTQVHLWDWCKINHINVDPRPCWHKQFYWVTKPHLVVKTSHWFSRRGIVSVKRIFVPSQLEYKVASFSTCWISEQYNLGPICQINSSIWKYQNRCFKFDMIALTNSTANISRTLITLWLKPTLQACPLCNLS